MVSSVTAHQLFNRARERERFAERRSIAYLNDHARDAARGRFFAKLTKDAGQFLFAVIVYDCCRCEGRLRVHPHVERTVSHQAETALSVLKLSGRHTQIEKHAADAANPELVENTIGVSEICLPHDDSPAKVRQTVGHMPDRIRI